MAWGRYGGYPDYMSVAQRRANALLEMDKLRTQGEVIEPVKIEGRQIAQSFWGKSWCKHLESFSDFESRLPRGRTYARNGSICHLAIESGRIQAIVSGSELYNINIVVAKLEDLEWQRIKQRCTGQIGSMLELLQGKLSDQVMTLVTDHQSGLFPELDQIKLECSCPDWATMCKHVAAVLYGVGNRLDAEPHLLFTMRGVDPQELIAADLALPGEKHTDAQTLADDQLAEIFGIDLPDTTPIDPPSAEGAATSLDQPKAKKKAKRVTKKSSAVILPRALTSTRKQVKSTTSRKPSGDQGSGRAKAKRSEKPDKPAMAPTGKAIVRIRRRAGLTQAQFARELGVSNATVARWEVTSGRLKLQSRSLTSLAKLNRKLQSE